eukprot:3460812-Prymnesium_polylepis.2
MTTRTNRGRIVSTATSACWPSEGGAASGHPPVVASGGGNVSLKGTATGGDEEEQCVEGEEEQVRQLILRGGRVCTRVSHRGRSPVTSGRSPAVRATGEAAPAMAIPGIHRRSIPGSHISNLWAVSGCRAVAGRVWRAGSI